MRNRYRSQKDDGEVSAFLSIKLDYKIRFSFAFARIDYQSQAEQAQSQRERRRQCPVGGTAYGGQRERQIPWAQAQHTITSLTLERMSKREELFVITGPF